MNAAAHMSSDYNQISVMQAQFMKGALDEQLEWFRLACSGKKHVRVLELGCATGGNSVLPVQKMQELLGDDAILEIFHCDLAQNNWTDMMMCARHYLEGKNGTFSFCIGRSFYEQNIVPPESIDFCFSHTALHWVRRPLRFPSCLEELDTFWFGSESGEEKIDSMRILVDNALRYLRRGGVCFWTFYGGPENAAECVEIRDWVTIGTHCTRAWQETLAPCWLKKNQTKGQQNNVEFPEMRVALCSRPVSCVKKVLEEQSDRCKSLRCEQVVRPVLSHCKTAEEWSSVRAQAYVAVTFAAYYEDAVKKFGEQCIAECVAPNQQRLRELVTQKMEEKLIPVLKAMEPLKPQAANIHMAFQKL